LQIVTGFLRCPLPEHLVELLWTHARGGIPPDNLSNIFDRYFTTKKEGTGLGLAVVDRIVKAHGGFVEVRSQPGKGTRFFVNLADQVNLREAWEGLNYEAKYAQDT